MTAIPTLSLSHTHTHTCTHTQEQHEHELALLQAQLSDAREEAAAAAVMQGHCSGLQSRLQRVLGDLGLQEEATRAAVQEVERLRALLHHKGQVRRDEVKLEWWDWVGSWQKEAVYSEC